MSVLRSDSLSKSQDSLQASPGSHRRSLLDEALVFTCASHTWRSLMSYREAKSDLVERLRRGPLSIWPYISSPAKSDYRSPYGRFHSLMAKVNEWYSI